MNYIDTHPITTALGIAALVLLTLAKLYPAKLYLFQIKFNYVHGATLMQFKKVPNILARIFFYSTPKTVIYIGNNRQWHTFKDMGPDKKITSRRMVQFLFHEEARERIAYRKRIAKKER